MRVRPLAFIVIWNTWETFRTIIADYWCRRRAVCARVRVCVCNQFVFARTHTHTEARFVTRRSRASPTKKDTFGICPATDARRVGDHPTRGLLSALRLTARAHPQFPRRPICRLGGNEIIDYAEQISCAHSVVHLMPPLTRTMAETITIKMGKIIMRSRTHAPRSPDRNKTRPFSQPNGPPIITHKHALI